MRVIANFKDNYDQDPVRFLEFPHDTWGPVFQYGLQRPRHEVDIYLDLEEPILIPGASALDYGHLCKKILVLAPGIDTYYSSLLPNTKCNFVFFPFNRKYIPAITPKVFDIIFTGHIVSQELRSNLETMRKFKYACVSMSQDPLVTHQNTTYLQKLHLIASSKATLIHNIIWVNDELEGRIKKLPNWETCEAFKHLDQRLIPQLKSRTFEAAFSKSLMLVRRDPFNIIEHFFEPGKEFIYFDPNNLEESLHQLNSLDIEKITEAAFNRAINNYTTEHFKEKYLCTI